MHNKPHTKESKAKMSSSHLGIPNFARRRPVKTINGIEYFKCGRCHGYFPREGFYKNKRTILGITSECKTCHCQVSLATRDKEKARDNNKYFMRRAYALNPEKFRLRNRLRTRPKDERVIARRLLNQSVKSGKVVKPNTCQDCGKSTKLTAHHEDYSKPLEVRWLCYECHGKRHRKVS